MKKTMIVLTIVALAVFLIAWGLMGVKIFSHDYDFMAEGYIALACLLILLVCALYRIFHRGSAYRCPHCGKLRLTAGAYCAYCGKKI